MPKTIVSSCSKILVDLIEPNPLLRRVITQRLLAHSRIQLLNNRKPSFRRVDSLSSEFPLVHLIDRGTLRTRFRDVVRQVITQNPDSRIAVLDDADLPLAEICSLIRCGIHGYLPYTELNKSLIDTILRLARQELWFTPSVLDHYVRLTNGAMQRTKAEGLRLTFRQEQIMSLLKKGSSNKEISAALNISESTVKFHLAKIFNKLGVRDRRSIMAQHIPSQAEQPLSAFA